MKTVKITIEVEVSDWATYVAADKNVKIYEYEIEPTVQNGDRVWDTELLKFNEVTKIINWKDTLTEVKE